MVPGIVVIVSLAALAMKPQSDLLHQLTLIALGATLIAAFQYIVSGWQRAREAKHADKEGRKMKEQPGEIDVFRAGNFRIDDMRVYALSTKYTPYTKYKRINFRLQLAEERLLPEEWAVIHDTVLPHLIAEAKARGAVFSDGPQVDMVKASIDRDRRAEEPNTINVEVTKTSYFRFAAMSNRLDEVVDGLGTTLRDRWTKGSTINLFNVDILKSPAVIGTVTVVVTADHFLLLHIRSRQVYQVNSGVHFVGEGMLPADHRPDRPLDPRETAIRALKEELGLDLGDPVLEGILKPTAFVFDTKRWQPVFCYIAEVPISFSELEAMLPIAKDSFETLGFTRLPFDIDDQQVRQLLLNKHDKWHLSSNHASMALYAALVWHHGPVKVSQSLNKSDNWIKERAAVWVKRASTLLNKASVARMQR